MRRERGEREERGEKREKRGERRGKRREWASHAPSECSPATSDVKELLSLLQLEFVADERHLVLLGSLEALVEALEH